MLDPGTEPTRRDGRLDPDSVVRTSFGTQFRGFDQDEVRAFLMTIADELRAGYEREAELAAQLAAAEDGRAGRGEPAELDEAALTAALGEETARVLGAARAAAAEIRSKAEANTARLVREAQDSASGLRGQAEEAAATVVQEAEAEANRLRADAHGVLDRRVQEAEAVARGITEAASASASSARAEAEQVLADAMAEAERARAGATDEVDRTRSAARAAGEAALEEARERGRELVREAQLVRKQVLDELSYKRRVARDQLERLRAGRDRLLESYAVVRRTMEEATGELDGALDEARLAADAAARRLPTQDWPVASGPPGATAAPSLGSAGEQAPAAAAVARPEPSPNDRPDVAEASEATEASGPAPPEESAPLRPPGPSAMVGAAGPEVEVAGAVDGEHAGPVPSSGREAVTASIVSVDVNALFARLRAEAPVPLESAGPSELPSSADTTGLPLASPENGAAGPSPAASEAPNADRLSMLERRDAVTDEIEHRLIRRLKRVLADEENEVLDALRRGGSLHDLLPDVDAHHARHATAAEEFLDEAVRAGAGFSSGAAGRTVVDPNAGDAGAELAFAVVTAIRQRVEDVSQERAGDDESLAEGVRACYREWRTTRIGEAGRHAVLVAFTRGVYDATPLDACLQWLVDETGPPCPDAEDNALAGAVPRGEPFPTGHAHPPAHPGCRCMVVAVAPGADASTAPMHH